MATILLQAAGTFLGGALGPVGSAIGSAAGALAGYAIDRALIDSTRHHEGPRLSATRPFTAEEGAPIPRVYGTVRLGGTLIWATRFEEESTTTRQGFKGGARTTSYAYFANAAFALCEGEIAGVRRIWADGREVDRDRVEIRVYQGSESQPVDPLVEARQGTGNAPAYRGTAHVVVERFPIDDYGRRLPQFQFEVLRPVDALNGRIRSLALIPGSTEYGLSPEQVTLTVEPGETRTVNRHVLSAGSDLVAALDEVQMLCPNLETIALVVTWFGDDLRAGHCRIRPMVAHGDPGGLSAPWVVSGVERTEAAIVSQVDGGAAYGGTPTDRSVTDAIAEIRQRGLKVVLYPFIMMDVPEANALPDPHGGASQPAYPWRGRITCDPAPGRPESADKTAAARGQVEAFAGNAAPADFAADGDTIAFSGGADDWGYRRFLLHYAHLAAEAGGVDGFLVGSELRGLTALRDEESRFAFVETLEALAAETRTLLGGDTLITYGADWSEYFGHQPADGSDDVIFHLDSLWAHPAVDAVGIDNYMPLSDWRDPDYAGGNPDGFAAPYDSAGLRTGVSSGEGYDWYYASAGDRLARERTPITDGAHGKPWMFRYKDLVSWWSNQHFDRPGGVEAGEPTAWVPQSKPIIFTELGCAAVDKGPNQPNVFPDPKSSEDGAPHFSDRGRSDLAQRRFLSAHYDHWEADDDAANPISDIYGGRMVEPADICLWAWDARPFPAFPLFRDVWSDGGNWSRGHWLNGRISGVQVGDLVKAILSDHGLPPADTTRADGTVSGYVAVEPGSARAALEPVTTLFGLAVREEAGTLVVESQGASADAAAEPDDLVLEDGVPVLELVRDAAQALPAQAVLDFSDPLNEHQAATVRAMRAGAAGSRTAFVSFPGVLSAGAAQSLLTDWLRRQWAGRERVTFAVPPADHAIAPGALVSLPDAEAATAYLVTEVDEGLKRTVTARRLDRVPPTPWAGERTTRPAAVTAVAGRPLALVLDLPLRAASDTPQDQMRLAVRARPWLGQVALASPEETGFEPRATISRRATIGHLTEDFAPGVAGRFDLAATITVALLDGELASVSRARLLNGANAAAVRSDSGAWEIVQFETAEETAPSVWRLSGLLRAQLGTDDAMTAGAAQGQPFVLLDDAVRPAGLLAPEIGLELNWRVGPVGHDVSQDNFLALSATGGVRAQLPLSPVHLRGWMTGAGDLELDWTRRGRIDADSWLGEDIPLGEPEELYHVMVAPAGGATLRTETVAQSSWTYTAAAMAADFAALPGELDITVSQIGATGAGLPATKTVPLG